MVGGLPWADQFGVWVRLSVAGSLMVGVCVSRALVCGPDLRFFQVTGWLIRSCHVLIRDQVR